MYSKTSERRSALDGQLRPWTSSFLRVAKKLSARALRLLCQGGLLSSVEVGEGRRVDAAGDVAHEAAAALLGALALGGAALDVVAGLGVMDHAVVGDQPERAVGLAFAAPVEAMARGLAG